MDTHEGDFDKWISCRVFKYIMVHPTYWVQKRNNNIKTFHFVEKDMIEYLRID